MKKILTIAFAAFLVTTSCVKNYNCECVFSDNGSPYLTTTDVIAGTKKNAKAECDDLTDNTPDAAGTTVACTIK